MMWHFMMYMSLLNFSPSLCVCIINSILFLINKVSKLLGLVQSLVAGRQIAAAAVAEGDSCEFASPHYFALCGLGGNADLIFTQKSIWYNCGF